MREHFTVMITDASARAHAISCKYEEDPEVRRIIVAPGNPFIGYKRQKEVIIAGSKECSLKDPASLLAVAQKYGADFVDVCQDDALAAGTVDEMERNGIPAFGPDRESATIIEADKGLSREFMKRNSIPHPVFRYFENAHDAKTYVRSIYAAEPEKVLYVKAKGLCAGKGALEARSLDEACRRIDQMKDFREAGKGFLIEYALRNSDGSRGEEFSYFVVSDGKTWKPFRSANDNKLAGDFDTGEQTGGMGGNSDALAALPCIDAVHERIVGRAIRGMEMEGHPYKGILYVGGIIADSRPLVVEFNARFGAPEAEIIVPGIKTSYLRIAQAAREGKLHEVEIDQDSKTRVGIVGASRGYPGDYSAVRGKRIYGLDEAMKMPGVCLFSAGLGLDGDMPVAAGGRLFTLVAEGANIKEARERAYEAMARIHVEGNNLHYRKDIGWRDLERFLRAA